MMTPSVGGLEDVGDIHLDDPEFSHPSHEQSILLDSEQVHSPLPEDEEDEDHINEISSWERLPWWKRPSPYWIIFGALFSAIGFSSLFAPKVALYTALVCRVHRPQYGVNSHSSLSFAFPLTHDSVSIIAADEPIPLVSDRSEISVDTMSVPLACSTCTSSSDYPENNSDPVQKCASDPVVQAVVARLNAVFTTSTGILSCLTAGWWGSLSDRHGRRTVFLICIFGLFVADFTHIITAWFVDVLPGGYWFPLAGSLIEGLCGGVPSGVAITNAYLADTTDPSARSRYFSLMLGLLYTGVAVGPVLGGLLIRSTGTILSVFFFACVIRGIYNIYILFILPESLTRARMQGARLRRRQEKANQVSNGCALVLKGITSLLSSLVVLSPEQFAGTSPRKQKRRDWSLFFIAIAYAFVASAFGSLSYQFQYAAAQFKWTPETTSYYVSFTGAVRAFFLVAVLPFIIKYFKTTPVQLPSTPDEHLSGTTDLSPSRSVSSLPGVPQTNASEQHHGSPVRPLAFDLALARASAGLESVALLGMAVASTGMLFTLASTVGSFAAGFSPAIEALVLNIHTSRHPQNQGNIGKLFGALSVVQALASYIISPAMYGFVYSNTVARFPQAIMMVSMSTSLFALIFLFFVHIPSKQVGDLVIPGYGNEQGSEGTSTANMLFAAENEVEGR